MLRLSGGVGVFILIGAGIGFIIYFLMEPYVESKYKYTDTDVIINL